MKKRFLALFLCVIMVIGVSPVNFDVSVFAERIGGYVGYLRWDYDLNTFTLTFSGSGEIGNFTDPDSVPWSSYCNKAKSVIISDGITEIGRYALYHFTALTSISIPVSVTRIDQFAFSGCTALTSISIPDSVTYIGNDAFYNCTGLTRISIPKNLTVITGFAGCTGLTSVTIPDSVTIIGFNAFQGCTGLTNITIPDGVTSIGDFAFSGCTGLTSITIPNSVTSIGNYAFSDCTGFTSITIPDGVTGIGQNAFSYCTGLTSITIPDSVTSIGGSAFSYCTGLTSVTIPDSVTIIGSDAFKYTAFFDDESNWENGVFYIGNHLIKAKISLSGAYEIKNGTKYIQDEAFYKCTALTSISIPDSVTSIGDHAFSGCTGLTSVTIPDSVTSIDSYAFDGCTGLTSITIPESVTFIGANPFTKCTGLEIIKVSEGNPVYHSSSNCIIKTEGKVLVSVGKSGVIPNDENITIIGVSAFSGCTGLTSITIPSSVTSIGDYAFSGCSGLTSITIPDSVTRIGNSAFTKLTDVYYYGTKEKWYKISIGIYNNSLNSAVRHYYTEVPEQPASCLMDGISAYSFWSNTEPVEYIVEPVSINALGHNIVHHTGKPSTCKEKGYADYDTCSRCDYTTYSELPLADHTSATAVKENVKKATCTESGYYDSVVYCSVCGEELNRDTVNVPMIDHSPTTIIKENIIAATCTENGSYDSVVYCSVCGKELSRKTETTAKTGHKDKNNDGVCDICGTVTDTAKHNAYLLGKAKINVKSSATVDYRSTVTVTATASGLPEGYVLAVYEGSSLKAKGSATSVSYNAGELMGNKTFTVKVVNSGNTPQKDSSGKEVNKTVEVKVKSGFFDKLIAFFRNLFGSLPKVEIKP